MKHIQCIYQPVKTHDDTVAVVDFMTQEQRDSTVCHCPDCCTRAFRTAIKGMPYSEHTVDSIVDKTFYRWIVDMMNTPPGEEKVPTKRKNK